MCLFVVALNGEDGDVCLFVWLVWLLVVIAIAVVAVAIYCYLLLFTVICSNCGCCCCCRWFAVCLSAGLCVGFL